MLLREKAGQFCPAFFMVFLDFLTTGTQCNESESASSMGSDLSSWPILSRV